MERAAGRLPSPTTALIGVVLAIVVLVMGLAVPVGAIAQDRRVGTPTHLTGGSGGNGLDPRTSGVRIMDPTTTGKYPYSDGHMSYSNRGRADRQSVHGPDNRAVRPLVALALEPR
jgi:hypothetical protein